MREKGRRELRSALECIDIALRCPERYDALMSRALYIIEKQRDIEEEVSENYPESFRDCEKYFRIEDALQALSNAVEYLDEVINQPEEAGVASTDDVIMEILSAINA